MSFLDKIKGKTPQRHDQESLMPLPLEEDTTHDNPMEQTVRLHAAPSTLDDRMTRPARDTSIIAEAEPSQLAALGVDDDGEMPSASVSGLPVIGQWPVERQQRALFVLAGLGLLGLIVSAAVALNASSRAGQQIGRAHV